jgi:hypothetical protein
MSPRTPAVLAVVAAMFGAPAAAGAFTGPIVVKSGLDNPRGMNFGADNSLFVTEAGRAGTRCTGSVCAGATGAIVRLQGDRLERVFEGLVSVGPRGGVDVTGPYDVGIATSAGACTWSSATGAHGARGASRPGSAGSSGSSFASTRSGPGSLEILAGLQRGRAALRPVGRGDRRDAAVDRRRRRRHALARARRQRLARRQLPAGVAATAVRMGPDGALYVGEFTRSAKVWRMVPGQQPAVFARGFTRITGLSFGPDGSLYVAEYGPSSGGRTPRGADRPPAARRQRARDDRQGEAALPRRRRGAQRRRDLRLELLDPPRPQGGARAVPQPHRPDRAVQPLVLTARGAARSRPSRP